MPPQLVDVRAPGIVRRVAAEPAERRAHRVERNAEPARRGRRRERVGDVVPRGAARRRSAAPPLGATRLPLRAARRGARATSPSHHRGGSRRPRCAAGSRVGRHRARTRRSARGPPSPPRTSTGSSALSTTRPPGPIARAHQQLGLGQLPQVLHAELAQVVRRDVGDDRDVGALDREPAPQQPAARGLQDRGVHLAPVAAPAWLPRAPSSRPPRPLAPHEYALGRGHAGDPPRRRRPSPPSSRTTVVLPFEPVTSATGISCARDHVDPLDAAGSSLRRPARSRRCPAPTETSVLAAQEGEPARPRRLADGEQAGLRSSAIAPRSRSAAASNPGSARRPSRRLGGGPGPLVEVGGGSTASPVGAVRARLAPPVEAPRGEALARPSPRRRASGWRRPARRRSASSRRSSRHSTSATAPGPVEHRSPGPVSRRESSSSIGGGRD